MKGGDPKGAPKREPCGGGDTKGTVSWLSCITNMDISLTCIHTLGLCGGFVGAKPHHMACVIANRLQEISA